MVLSNLSPTAPRRILVIRHGALGDFICTLGAFKAIRQHHREDHITLVTSRPYLEFAKATGYFDAYYIDNRPKLWRFHHWLKLRAWFRQTKFTRVYDLQTSQRTSFYYKFFGPGPRPEWSGIAPGCSHPQTTPLREKMHIFERFQDQLRQAGIPDTPLPSLEWLNQDISRFGLNPQDKHVLLIPGCSAKAEYKRWPPEAYAELASQLLQQGFRPIVLGGPDDQTVVARLVEACPKVINLAGQTSLFDIAGLAQKARAIVGNDTGPVHLAAATRQPTLMLFSGIHNPAWIAPTYPSVRVLTHYPLQDLPVIQVWEVLSKFFNAEN